MIRNFDEMSRMFEQMDSMFDGMRTGRVLDGRTTDLDGMRTTHDDMPMRRDDTPTGRDSMQTKLFQEDGEYVFVMDLPGYETEEIDLVYRDGDLHVTASTETSDETETSYTRYSRSTSETIAIPGDVDVEAVEASYHNGVLEVALPRLGDVADDGHVIDLR